VQARLASAHVGAPAGQRRRPIDEQYLVLAHCQPDQRLLGSDPPAARAPAVGFTAGYEAGPVTGGGAADGSSAAAPSLIVGPAL
jgi:hypothetical protein